MTRTWTLITLPPLQNLVIPVRPANAWYRPRLWEHDIVRVHVHDQYWEHVMCVCMCMCMYVHVFPDISCQSMNREIQIYTLKTWRVCSVSVNVDSHMGFACSQTCMQLCCPPMNLHTIKYSNLPKLVAPDNSQSDGSNSDLDTGSSSPTTNQLAPDTIISKGITQIHSNIK